MPSQKERLIFYIRRVIDCLSSDSLSDEWKRAFKSTESDPADAMTAGRALVESTYNIVLETRGDELKGNIYEKALERLGLQAYPIYDQVASLIGKLRNYYYNAHGPGSEINPVEPRTESSGGHFRKDYPRRDAPAWLVWVKFKDEQGDMMTYKEPIPKEWCQTYQSPIKNGIPTCFRWSEHKTIYSIVPKLDKAILIK